jgi:orotate phosphoribosyltransferase
MKYGPIDVRCQAHFVGSFFVKAGKKAGIFFKIYQIFQDDEIKAKFNVFLHETFEKNQCSTV